MDNKSLIIVLLAASALILILEISIFLSVIPPKINIKGLEEYKKQVNSTLSDKEFVEELIAQNLAYRERVDELEEELMNQEIIITYLMNRSNASISVETSPFKRISKEDVKVYNDRVIIYVNKAFPASFTESMSMYPFISQDVFALEVRPETPEELNIGDIIGFESKTFNTTIIHRIVGIGEDELGWYAITKGDNNPTQDPDRARFDDIKGVLVGLIY